MKKRATPPPSTRSHRAALLLTLLAAQCHLSAGPTNPAANTNTNPATKTEATFTVPPPFIEPPVPQSQFIIPKKSSDGKDPFFPKSTRVISGDTPIAKPGPTPVVAELLLRGISGSDEQPLAIINTTTFGLGDTLDVTTKAGKMSIRCLEINKTTGTVLVQIGGERRELRLPPQK